MIAFYGMLAAKKGLHFIYETSCLMRGTEDKAYVQEFN